MIDVDQAALREGQHEFSPLFKEAEQLIGAVLQLEEPASTQ